MESTADGRLMLHHRFPLRQARFLNKEEGREGAKAE
jgi:hypothetical protein